MNERLKDRIAEEWAMLDPVDPLRGLLSDVIDVLAQPAQDLQVRTGDCLLVGVCASEGHKIQAQRPWVGLTDEEIEAIYLQHHNQYGECESPNWGYERAIEQALKEKNT